MTRLWRCVLPGLALLSIVAGSPALATEITPPEGDRELLQEVIRESRIETEIPGPGVGAYLSDLTLAALEGLAEIIYALLPGLGKAGDIGWRVLLAVGLLLLAAMLVAAAVRWVKNRPAAVPGARSSPPRPVKGSRQPRSIGRRS